MSENTGSTIDLDAAAAARAEVAESLDVTAPTVRFKGKSYEMPLELPFGAFMRMGAVAQKIQAGTASGAESIGSMYGLLKALFGERVDEFVDDGPTEADIEAMLGALADAYGVDLGKASASLESSDSTTTQ